jgi:predicted transposase YbfD/YdcC
MAQLATQGAEYLLAVKANQPELLDLLERTFAACPHYRQAQQQQRGHGRQMNWQIRVIETLPAQDWGWMHLHSLIQVNTQGRRQDRPFAQVRYYISSLRTSARGFLSRIREHWQIENRVHWLKDVVLGEDRHRLCQHNSVAVWSWLRSMAINLSRVAVFKSLTAAIDALAHDLPALFAFC